MLLDEAHRAGWTVVDDAVVLRIAHVLFYNELGRKWGFAENITMLMRNTGRGERQACTWPQRDSPAGRVLNTINHEDHKWEP